MATIPASSLTQGMNVTFKTRNPHDNVVWTGKIIAVCTYDVAKMFTDVDSYHQQVARADVETNFGDVTTNSYVVLQSQDSQGAIIKQAFATVWIDESTLSVVDVNAYVDIRIYSISESKASDIATYITDQYGYVTKVLSK